VSASELTIQRSDKTHLVSNGLSNPVRLDRWTGSVVDVLGMANLTQPTALGLWMFPLPPAPHRFETPRSGGVPVPAGTPPFVLGMRQVLWHRAAARDRPRHRIESCACCAA
jgi:hypothetical protein